MGAVGAYGKIPSLGDFFRIGSNQAFVEPWDNWLQAGLLSAREQLAQDWDKYYLTAPIWRFSLSPGLAGPGAVAGIMMPSVDRVGRQFPLTIMAVFDDTISALDLHFQSRKDFETLEDIALDALSEQSGRDEIAAVLAETPAISAPTRTGVARRPGQLAIGAGPMPLATLAAHLAADKFRRPSIWSTGIEPERRLLIDEEMPDPSIFHSFLNLDAAFWRDTEDHGASF